MIRSKPLMLAVIMFLLATSRIPANSQTQNFTPPPQPQMPVGQPEQDNQLTALKTIYDMPQDRLAEMFAQKTSAEIQQIKSSEYLKRETLRNLLKNLQLPQAQTDYIAEVIKSEEDFDNKLEAIRVKKHKKENQVKTTKAILGYLHNVGQSMNNTMNTLYSNAPMQPMQPIQPLQPMPMTTITPVSVNGQMGTITTTPGLGGTGGVVNYFGPAFK